MSKDKMTVRELAKTLNMNITNTFRLLASMGITSTLEALPSPHGQQVATIDADSFNKAVTRIMTFRADKAKPVSRDSWGNRRKSAKPFRAQVKECSAIEGEIWVPVVGYENFSEVSSIGRIRSIKRMTNHNNCISGTQEVGGTLYSLASHYLGYKITRLMNENGYKTVKVHRVVAEAFIPNPDKKRTVNHKNGIRNDNRVENLEWATQAENNAHAANRNRELIKKYKNAYDLTAEIGINPDAVKDLYDSLVETLAQFKKIDKHYSKDHQIMERAEAAINKAKITNHE
jgi:hypothetical protein